LVTGFSLFYREKSWHIFKIAVMKKGLFITSSFLCISWVLGISFFKAGITVHVLLLVAAILFMQAVILTPKAQTSR
jgi:hypothetical protein